MSFRLLIFLFWLGCGTSYRVISAVFNVSTSTVHNIVPTTMDNILTNLTNKVIHYPSIDQTEDVGRGSGRLARSQIFDNAVGAIGGCHVKVRVIGPNKKDYFNRKLDCSVQFQAVVDDQSMFLNIYSEYPDSVLDSRVLRASTLYRNREYPPQGYFLLGDGGYPLLQCPICLITPYRNPNHNDADKLQFNLFHSRARSIVERAFDIVKARWRTMFMKTVEIRHTKVARLIAVCCIMHNVCMSLGDILQPVLEPENAEPNEEAEQADEAHEEEATVYRNHMARRLNVRDLF
uniref:DDE Tnp4 domain-containing protein n=1 Tax=Timema poppense TaxID=170557 RepID=A0A7R9H651_TIMPO|nr:unnamed protein product [Timema poppensis]